ncbi:hypothetical protein EYC98_17295 [Halieaceae bacterium IMCC14734]|uniref:Uncharacterized protein n=1 Tax=Candidatus Litorirhabdus singularis TaxID=2518993 RepID=A0ABT3TMK0_9GAMM|nr:hypothetical protein [Candidatus Litorirhabdus singularis]MCX2982619.1 hypothetical protein [Candidatus Litorirhabdus singularis]
MSTADKHYQDGPEPLLVKLARSGDEHAFTELLQRRQQLVLRLALAALLIIGEWLLDAPLQQLVQQLTQAVTQSLVSVDSRWLELALTPVNSAASIVAVILLSALYLSQTGPLVCPRISHQKLMRLMRLNSFNCYSLQ